MPNFKSISFKMAVLQGGGQNLPSPCVCYPKDPTWNRVKILFEASLEGCSTIVTTIWRPGFNLYLSTFEIFITSV